MRQLLRIVGRALNLDPGLVISDGLVFHGAREHRQHLWAILVGRDEPLTVDRFLEELRPGDVVFDVGAYLGTFALRAARLVGPEGRVIAFEPDPSASAALSESVEANGLADRVAVVRAAVAEQGGVVTLHRHPSDPSQTSIVDDRPGERVQVEAIRLDEVEPAPTVLKVDAEGADLGVLRSLGGRLSRVRAVFVEYGNTTAVDDRYALLALLRSAGFERLEVINDRGGTRGGTCHPWPPSREDLRANYVNLCASRG